MNFWQEKQARLYILFCVGGITVFLLLMAGFGLLQGSQMKEMLFFQEQAFASSLLEQGVKEETVGAALNSKMVTENGAALLQKLGHTPETNSWMFPLIWQRTAELTIQLLALCFLAAVLFLSGTIYYLHKREALYQKAFNIVQAYAEGDFKQHLFGNQTGTIHQLFASVDELAVALQAKSETERQMKEFLKNIISDISHQLKTPLAALHMYLEIISEDAGQRDVVLDFAQKSSHSLERMEQLIASLLKIMRLDADN